MTKLLSLQILILLLSSACGKLLSDRQNNTSIVLSHLYVGALLNGTVPTRSDLVGLKQSISIHIGKKCQLYMQWLNPIQVCETTETAQTREFPDGRVTMLSERDQHDPTITTTTAAGSAARSTPLSDKARMFADGGRQTYQKMVDASNNRDPDTRKSEVGPEWMEHPQLYNSKSLASILRLMNIDGKCDYSFRRGTDVLQPNHLLRPQASTIIAANNFDRRSRSSSSKDHWNDVTFPHGKKCARMTPSAAKFPP